MGRGSVFGTIRRFLRALIGGRRETARGQRFVGAYPGDYKGIPEISYEPRADNFADPGEIVWTWVPFEEDYSKGKDRPVLVIGRDGAWLLALPLTSKDHIADTSRSPADRRNWLDIGPGSWDRQGRSSQVRINRIVRVDPYAVRRVANSFPRDTFEKVADAVRAGYRSR